MKLKSTRHFAAPMAFVMALSTPSLFAAPQTSALWGQNGEKWSQNGRLPDFSYAGYHRGEVPIPEVPQTANVKDFGAVGDGVTDDTKAIQAAINATNSGAVFVPPGRYLISDFIRIEKSNTVLRGAGPGKTVLWFPRGLDAVHPRANKTSTGDPASGYAFDGGFLTLEGNYGSQPLAKITALARRGDTSVEVDGAAGLKPGQRILILLQEDKAQSLKTYLYDGDPGGIKNGKMLDTKMLVNVVSVEGNVVKLDRPLRFETRPEWQAQIMSFEPTVTESGIEGIGFEFPGTRYKGHFMETGNNPLELRNVNNCWVRNVSIRNGDLGINIVACGNTVDGVTLTADKGRGLPGSGIQECTGHHGFQCKYAEDNLVTHFDLQASYWHDLSVEHASGNVYASGKGANVNFDHHKDTPYENLYTDIDCGAATRVWLCGGGDEIGRQSAGWETFWNIRGATSINPPPAGWGAKNMNFIGLRSTKLGAMDATGEWFEPLPKGNEMMPANLYAAQLKRRLAAKPK